MRTIFLRGGASSAIHRHDESASWIHVVSGEITEERWTRDAEGGFGHEQRRLHRGQSIAAPGDALHRVTAIEDATFVTTSVCDCGRAGAAAEEEIAAVMRLSRTGVDREWATVTAIGAPSPAAESPAIDDRAG